jgi:hypothetical protein
MKSPMICSRKWRRYRISCSQNDLSISVSYHLLSCTNLSTFFYVIHCLLCFNIPLYKFQRCVEEMPNSYQMSLTECWLSRKLQYKSQWKMHDFSTRNDQRTQKSSYPLITCNVCQYKQSQEER